MLQQLEMMNFVDVESKSPGFALVRAGDDEVGLTLSLEEDGDIAVYLRPAECEQLLSILQRAVLIAKKTAAPV